MYTCDLKSQKGDFLDLLLKFWMKEKWSFWLNTDRREFFGLKWGYSEYFEKREFPPKMDFFQKVKNSIFSSSEKFSQRKVEILVREGLKKNSISWGGSVQVIFHFYFLIFFLPMA